MTRVTLSKPTRPTKRSPKRRVWLLRWYGTDGTRYCETIGDAARVTKREAEAIARDKQSKFDCGIVKSDRPPQMTLAQFIAQDRRPRQDKTGRPLCPLD